MIFGGKLAAKGKVFLPFIAAKGLSKYYQYSCKEVCGMYLPVACINSPTVSISRVNSIVCLEIFYSLLMLHGQLSSKWREDLITVHTVQSCISLSQLSFFFFYHAMISSGLTARPQMIWLR